VAAAGPSRLAGGRMPRMRSSHFPFQSVLYAVAAFFVAAILLTWCGVQLSNATPLGVLGGLFLPLPSSSEEPRWDWGYVYGAATQSG